MMCEKGSNQPYMAYFLADAHLFLKDMVGCSEVGMKQLDAACIHY